MPFQPKLCAAVVWAALFYAIPAVAQTVTLPAVCSPRDRMVERLKREYREVPYEAGVASNGALAGGVVGAGFMLMVKKVFGL